ncbi:3-isopropylmalate dehydratase small subunit [Rhodobacterales bacterium LSUCC0387]|nr:3-isopropylmalate dehydratase small subunit [Rhodobacterales bacterium LSUCC0387]
MKPFTNHIGVALPLLADNLNTDVIIPSREMKRVSKVGLANGLFANIRYSDGNRKPDPEFLLNHPNYHTASILILGRNAGCGSSREHAVWALADYGFRVVLAESFASIFYNNCVANGVLPITLDRSSIEAIADWVRIDPTSHHLSANLEKCTLETVDNSFEFVITPLARRMLLNGLAPIDLTLEDKVLIDCFIAEDMRERQWLYSVSD